MEVVLGHSAIGARICFGFGSLALPLEHPQKKETVRSIYFTFLPRKLAWIVLILVNDINVQPPGASFPGHEEIFAFRRIVA